MSAPPLNPLRPEPGPEGAQCRGCVWYHRTQKGMRCHCHPGQAVRGDWPACPTWAGALDCAACGACCREAYHTVELSPRDKFQRLFPALVKMEDGRPTLPRPGGRCVCLTGELGSFACTHYADRPKTCRDFEVGSFNCLEARRRVGLQPRNQLNK